MSQTLEYGCTTYKTKTVPLAVGLAFHGGKSGCVVVAAQSYHDMMTTLCTCKIGVFGASLKRKCYTRVSNKIQTSARGISCCQYTIAPFGDAYEKIGTIQRRLAWPLHKDDTLFQSGRPTGLNIYFISCSFSFLFVRLCHLPYLTGRWAGKF